MRPFADFIFPLTLGLCFLSCSNYRGNDFSDCTRMENSAREIRMLVKANDELAKRNEKLSNSADINSDEIANNENRILSNHTRIERLEEETRLREKSCQPMFEDPQRKKARNSGYQR